MSPRPSQRTLSAVEIPRPSRCLFQAQFGKANWATPLFGAGLALAGNEVLEASESLRGIAESGILTQCADHIENLDLESAKKCIVGDYYGPVDGRFDKAVFNQLLQSNNGILRKAAFLIPDRWEAFEQEIRPEIEAKKAERNRNRQVDYLTTQERILRENLTYAKEKLDAQQARRSQLMNTVEDRRRRYHDVRSQMAENAASAMKRRTISAGIERQGELLQEKQEGYRKQLKASKGAIAQLQRWKDYYFAPEHSDLEWTAQSHIGFWAGILRHLPIWYLDMPTSMAMRINAAVEKLDNLKTTAPKETHGGDPALAEMRQEITQLQSDLKTLSNAWLTESIADYKESRAAYLAAAKGDREAMAQLNQEARDLEVQLFNLAQQWETKSIELQKLDEEISVQSDRVKAFEAALWETHRQLRNLGQIPPHFPR